MEFGIIIGDLVCLIGGIFIGFMIPRKRKISSTQPFCGCSHHLAFHNLKRGVCTGTKRVKVRGLSEAFFDLEPMYAFRDCKCQQYSGPQPLDVLYAPDVI